MPRNSQLIDDLDAKAKRLAAMSGPQLFAAKADLFGLLGGLLAALRGLENRLAELEGRGDGGR